MTTHTTTGYVIDQRGIPWPLTGWYCDVCHMPMHPSNAPYGTHPTCDVGATA